MRVRQPVALFVDRARSLRHRQLAGHSALQRIGDLGLDQGNRVALLLPGQLQLLVQLFIKIAIAHLLEDGGVPRFVDLEGFAAVWTDDFVNGGWTCSSWLD